MFFSFNQFEKIRQRQTFQSAFQFQGFIPQSQMSLSISLGPPDVNGPRTISGRSLTGAGLLKIKVQS
jgi:hypothetical protein